MSIQKQLPRQRDFSAGELVSYTKRADDDEFMRAGARTMRNWRVLAKGFEQRPGRSLKYIATGRTEEVRMSATATYQFTFGDDTIVIRDDTDAVVATDTGNDWNLTTVDQINWEQFGNDVFVTFPGQKPRVARWDGATTWTFLDFAYYVAPGGQKRSPFYRLSPLGVTMLPAQRTGTGIAVTFSAGMNLVAGHVGTRMRFLNRQVQIASVLTATTGTIDIIDPLPGSQVLSSLTNPATVFAIGDEVVGGSTQSKGIVISFPSSTSFAVQLLSTTTTTNIYGTFAFQNPETVIGPTGTLVLSANGGVGTPLASTNWDDEVVNDLRGWPQSVFSDQSRLGFCDLPALPQGINWSAIGDPFDMYPGTDADEGIFELAPKKARVYHVAPGDDEFVLTDIGVYYIPISESNPLKPGSVAFRSVATEPSSAVRPVVTPDGTLFVGEGGKHLIAIVGTGQTARPYITRNVSEFHAHLFTDIRAIASASGGSQFSDRYVYALNTDGTLAVGRFNPARQWVGWVPWTAPLDGVIGWVSARGSSVLTVTQYTINSVARSYVERLDTDQYLDAAVPYNDIPAALAPGMGLGLLWFAAGGTVDLLKDGHMPYGSRAVDATGNIVEQEGDDLTDDSLMVGFTFTPTFEPFIPHVQPGQSVKQSQRKRSIARMMVTVENSSGGFTIGRRRVTAWRVGEDQALVPPLREESVAVRPLGRAYDPRVEIAKDVAGPLRILEVSTEVNV